MRRTLVGFCDITLHDMCNVLKKLVNQSHKLCFMRITLISINVCLFVINSLSNQWTPTGAVNASVSGAGAQMLNRLYRTIISPHKSHMKHVCHHQDV